MAYVKQKERVNPMPAVPTPPPSAPAPDPGGALEQQRRERQRQQQQAEQGPQAQPPVNNQPVNTKKVDSSKNTTAKNAAQNSTRNKEPSTIDKPEEAKNQDSEGVYQERGWKMNKAHKALTTTVKPMLKAVGMNQKRIDKFCAATNKAAQSFRDSTSPAGIAKGTYRACKWIGSKLRSKSKPQPTPQDQAELDNSSRPNRP